MQNASDSIRTVADSSLWWVSGFFAFHRSNFRTWTSKRTTANNLVLYAFVAAFVYALYSFVGVQGLAKYDNRI